MVKAARKTQTSSGNYLSQSTLAVLTAVSILVAVLGFGYIGTADSKGGFDVISGFDDYRLEVALGYGTREAILAFLIIALILGIYLISMMKNQTGKLSLLIPFIVSISLLIVIWDYTPYKTGSKAIDNPTADSNNTAGYATISYVTTALFFNLSACYFLYKENGGNKFYLAFALVSAIIYILYLIGVHYSGLTFSDRIKNYIAIDNQEFFDLTAACSILTTIFFATTIILLGLYRR